ncbi:MAG: HAMP domain-containing sensor histidine kinase [Polyangiaceae bacterium]
MLPRRSLRLSTRLAVVQGVLAALILVVLVVTTQGVFRMVGLITEIRDRHLSTVDAEAAIHRHAWRVDLALRHGRSECMQGAPDEAVRAAVQKAYDEAHALRDQVVPGTELPLWRPADRYFVLARTVLDRATCPTLLDPVTDRVRADIDEDMTDSWIARMSELHRDIETKEDSARKIGVLTATMGITSFLFALVTGAVVARSTARSVADPVASLARAATRLGEGDFAPIPATEGVREVEDLGADLERMRLRLLELEQLKRSFLHSVSHELRTPLARLREALALLFDGTVGPLTSQQSRVVGLAVRACEREVRLVEALLDLSRLQAGQPIKLVPRANLDQVVRAAVDDERADAEARGVAIEVLAEGPSPTVTMDSVLVERAIANLVRNAVSVSAANQTVRVRRTVALSRDPSVPTTLVLEIEDDGPGIPENARGTLFRPFSAAPVPGADRPAGAGLGLSFAWEVAKAHAGSLILGSGAGSGASFRFEIPLRDPPSP